MVFMSPQMSDEQPRRFREIVALGSRNAVLAPKRDAVRRLPSIEDGDGWPSIDQLQEAVGRAGLVLLGPPRRYAGEPLVTLHVLTVPTPAPELAQPEDWLPLDRLHELADGADVPDTVRGDIAEALGEASRTAGRADWLRFGWFDEARDWVDDQLDRLGLRRTGPTTVLQMWSMGSLMKTPVAGPDGQESAVILKASCSRFAA